MLVEFLLIFIVACAASYALRKQIRAYPWTFYLFAIALDGVLLPTSLSRCQGRPACSSRPLCTKAGWALRCSF